MKLYQENIVKSGTEIKKRIYISLQDYYNLNLALKQNALDDQV